MNIIVYIYKIFNNYFTNKIINNCFLLNKNIIWIKRIVKILILMSNVLIQFFVKMFNVSKSTRESYRECASVTKGNYKKRMKLKNKVNMFYQLVEIKNAN